MGRTDGRTDGHSTVTKTHAPHYADSAGTDDVVSEHECETFSNGTLEILSVIFDTTSSQWESEWTKLIVTGNDGRGTYFVYCNNIGSRVVSVLDSEGRRRPGFKSQSRRYRVTVMGKLFTPIVPLFTKQRNW